VIWDSLDVQYLKTQLDKLTNLNTTLTDLRDDLRGTENRTLTDLHTLLSGIKGQSDKLSFDGSNNLLVYLQGGSSDIGNFPTWFTASTKKIDDLFTKLDALDDALDPTTSDKFRTSIVDSLPYGDEWIGRTKIGDGTNLVNVIATTFSGSGGYGLAIAPDLVKAVSGGTHYTETEFSVGTDYPTEPNADFSPPLKFAVITNRSATVNVTAMLNGSSASEMTISAGTAKVIMFPLSEIYCKGDDTGATVRIVGFE